MDGDFVVKEGTLAVWNDSDLIAVVLVQHKTGKREAMLLWFSASDLSNLRKAYIPSHSRVVHSGASDFHVLAVNGAFQGDGIVIVLGTIIQEAYDRKVETITVTLDECPIPGIKGESKTSFK